MYFGICKSLWRKNMGKLPTHPGFPRLGRIHFFPQGAIAPARLTPRKLFRNAWDQQFPTRLSRRKPSMMHRPQEFNCSTCTRRSFLYKLTNGKTWRVKLLILLLMAGLFLFFPGVTPFAPTTGRLRLFYSQQSHLAGWCRQQAWWHGRQGRQQHSWSWHCILATCRTVLPNTASTSYWSTSAARNIPPIIGPRILPLHPGETLNAGEIFNQAGPFPASTGSRKLCYLVKGLVDKGLGSNMPVGSPNKKTKSLLGASKSVCVKATCKW